MPHHEPYQRHPVAVHNLYALRTAIHLSAPLVARACGVCTDTYYRWEQGRSNPTGAQRRKLARVLRTTEAWLRQPNSYAA